MKFLIADDSSGKTAMLTRIVEKSQWPGKMLFAITTEEAEELITKNPDITAGFIDYYMPTQYGPSVIRYLRKKCPKAKIALVTSADSEANNKEAIASGADATVCTSAMSDIVEKRLLELLAQWEIELDLA